MAKTIAAGTVLKVGAVTVGNVTSISAPNPVKAEVDVTDFASTASEFLLGIPDNGEISMSGIFNYTDAGQLVLLGDANDPDAAARAFTLEFTRQDVQFSFNAYVRSFVPTASGPNDAYKFDATLRLTGAVTIAAIP